MAQAQPRPNSTDEQMDSPTSTLNNNGLAGEGQAFFWREMLSNFYLLLVTIFFFFFNNVQDKIQKHMIREETERKWDSCLEKKDPVEVCRNGLDGGIVQWGP